MRGITKVINKSEIHTEIFMVALSRLVRKRIGTERSYENVSADIGMSVDLLKKIIYAEHNTRRMACKGICAYSFLQLMLSLSLEIDELTKEIGACSNHNLNSIDIPISAGQPLKDLSTIPELKYCIHQELIRLIEEKMEEKGIRSNSAAAKQLEIPNETFRELMSYTFKKNWQGPSATIIYKIFATWKISIEDFKLEASVTNQTNEIRNNVASTSTTLNISQLSKTQQNVIHSHVDYKKILEYHYIHEMKSRQVAQRLNISKTTVNEFLNRFRECETLKDRPLEELSNENIKKLLYRKAGRPSASKKR